MSTIKRALRAAFWLAVGGLTGVMELCFVLLSVPLLPIPVPRQVVFTVANALTMMELRRHMRYLDDASVFEGHPGTLAWRYIAVRWVLGWAAGAILLAMAIGAVSGAVMGWQLLSGLRPGGDGPIRWYDPIVVVGGGTLLFFLAVQGLVALSALELRTARFLLRPPALVLLQRRVEVLTITRARVIEAVNEERRRIERDLHDGVQQRLVALGMLLGRARRATDQQHADDLLRQAHEESQRTLEDLRDVTWRVYPIALEEAGLHTALEAIAERSSIAVQLNYNLAERMEIAYETVAYFVASEAVTNAIKHSHASAIEITVSPTDDGVVLMVKDNGFGGAAMDGAGLSGLARRVAAVDGVFTVDSPAGGPTVIMVELPCA
jgi:signal transduction histidine kinase